MKEVEVADKKDKKKKKTEKDKKKNLRLQAAFLQQLISKKKKTEKVPWKVDLKVQDDGNLVLYREDGQVLWASNTAGRKSPDAESSLTVQGADGVLLKKAAGEDDGESKEDEEERWNADKMQDEKDATRDVDSRPVDDSQGEVEEVEGEDEGKDDDEMMAGSNTGDADREAPSAILSAGPSHDDDGHQELPSVGAHASKRRAGDRGRFSKRRVERASSSASPIEEVIDSLV